MQTKKSPLAKCAEVIFYYFDILFTIVFAK